ncbi:phosphatidyl inositol kinase [Agyrium rufum]|nr:phosphatidyl inositol kinase [Agyrium rufum]
MPRHRPPTSGYARISQAEENDHSRYLDDYDEDDAYQAPPTISDATPQYAPIQPGVHAAMRDYPESPQSLRHHRRPSGAGRRRVRSNSSGVDIKAINARLERWAEEIASKFKINKSRKTHKEERLEIHHSVFQAPEGMRPLTAEGLSIEGTQEQGQRMTKEEFEEVVESVRVAIEIGMHPKMISQGSSGSYFARNSNGKVVGVFKPKDEEPYASRNPKWTKWIHRNLFPCFFGRACLIPNLSYVSEAAAYTLDTRLRTNLVPYTDIVHLSSKSFFYDFWQRSNYYRKRRPLPPKVGSFQVFLKGFKDANIFLRDHPWPDQLNAGFRPQDAGKGGKRSWADACRPNGAASEEEDEALNPTRPTTATEEETQGRKFFWTDSIQQSFREELEKLVILDYIMRNTDRGLDNWMVKVDWATQEVSIRSEPMRLNGHLTEDGPRPVRPVSISNGTASASPYRRQETMAPTSRSGTPLNVADSGITPSISIGAIDNSLSWPWKHPDAWRSFPFGWLFLPVSLIGRPFSQKTRDHFLPLLSSTQWWSDTQAALREVFSQDSDFQERMFDKQIAVMKGQAWNVVETLKQPDHGPLELTRRTRVCVWDDLVDIPVAIPLGRPSAEMRRRAESQRRGMAEEEEEMDISAANGSARPSNQDNDLLGTSPPTFAELPKPSRFELPRNPGSSDSIGDPETPATISGVMNFTQEPDQHRNIRPEQLQRSRTRVSFEGGHRKRPSAGGMNGALNQRRRQSYATRNLTSSFLYDGDDLEGDLGYAAAEGMEGNQRKVIMERLETVKSKNPVFTWC